MDLNKKAKEIYNQNKEVGWWDNPNRCLYECLQLISTEIAEATEAERKDLMDDKLPHRKGGEVELADALTRTLDLGAHLGYQFHNDFFIFKEHKEFKNRLNSIFKNFSIGKLHLVLNLALLEKIVDYEAFMKGDFKISFTEEDYCKVIDMILIVGEYLGYNILDAMEEKLEYNKTRADHKRENRIKENGKKF